MGFEEINKMKDCFVKLKSLVDQKYNQISKDLYKSVSVFRSIEFNNPIDDELEEFTDDLVEIKSDFFSIVQTIKSISDEQEVHIDNIFTEMRILAKIIKDTNGKLQPKHVKNIDISLDRLLKTWKKFEETSAQIMGLLRVKLYSVQSREINWHDKLRSNEYFRTFFRDFLRENESEISLSDLDMGILLNEIFGRAGFKLGLTIPLAVVSVFFAVCVFFTVQYYKYEQDKYFQVKGKKQITIELKNEMSQLDNSMVEFVEVVSNLTGKENNKNQVQMCLEDIKLILTDDNRRDELLTDETFMNILTDCEQLLQNIKKIQTFK